MQPACHESVWGSILPPGAYGRHQLVTTDGNWMMWLCLLRGRTGDIQRHSERRRANGDADNDTTNTQRPKINRTRRTDGTHNKDAR
jgi:hypothetical protein